MPSPTLTPPPCFRCPITFVHAHRYFSTRNNDGDLKKGLRRRGVRGGAREHQLLDQRVGREGQLLHGRSLRRGRRRRRKRQRTVQEMMSVENRQPRGTRFAPLRMCIQLVSKRYRHKIHSGAVRCETFHRGIGRPVRALDSEQKTHGREMGGACSKTSSGRWFFTSYSDLVTGSTVFFSTNKWLCRGVRRR